MVGLIGQWNMARTGYPNTKGPYSGVKNMMVTGTPINSLRDLFAQAQMRMRRQPPHPTAPPAAPPVVTHAPLPATTMPGPMPEQPVVEGPKTYQSNPLSVPKSPGLIGWRG